MALVVSGSAIFAMPIFICEVVFCAELGLMEVAVNSNVLRPQASRPPHHQKKTELTVGSGRHTS
jgi:hypothetical protein